MLYVFRPTYFLLGSDSQLEKTANLFQLFAHVYNRKDSNDGIMVSEVRTEPRSGPNSENRSPFASNFVKS